MIGDKLVIDVSYYNDLSSKQWDLLATVISGVIIRLSFGNNTDSLAQKHIDQCNRLGLPFAGYHWVDPTVNIEQQLSKVASVVEEFKPVSMLNDYEQYWTDWDAYMRQDLVEAKRTKFTPSQLNTYYSNFNTKIRQRITTIPIGNYSALWFMNEYCPDMQKWIDENYFEARYLRYYDSPYWESEKSKFPFDISHMREIADNVVIVNGIARQFETYAEINGLSKWNGWHLDWSIFTPASFSLMFGGEPLPEIESDIIDMVGVSQIGYGADKHHNDCGLAASSADVLAAKGIFVPVDQWYEMDGWDAPIDDSGTYAYQLQKALALFEVRSNIGHSLSIQNIKDYIGRKLPIITLVNYKVLSDAGLTYYKGDFLHWFVVIGYDKDNVIVLDSYRPYESGLQITIPNQIFLSSYKGTYVVLVDSIKEGGTPMAYNGTVLANLNVRSSPNPEATRVGGLNSGDRVEVDLSTITSDNWGNVKSSNSSRQDYRPGWVSLFYVKLDSVIPDPPPTGDIDESAIRKDELSRAKAAFDAYFTERDAKL